MTNEPDGAAELERILRDYEHALVSRLALLLELQQLLLGAVGTRFKPLTVADLLTEGRASSENLRYVAEGHS